VSAGATDAELRAAYNSTPTSPRVDAAHGPGLRAVCDFVVNRFDVLSPDEAVRLLSGSRDWTPALWDKLRRIAGDS
jgi:hypothetical protein